MPRPNKGESKQDFVSRYMSDPESRKKYPDQDQRSAIAYSIYENKDKEATKMLKPSIDLTGKIILKAEEPPKPYGDVKYADPEEGKYPIDTEERIRAAFNYASKPKNKEILGAKAATVMARIVAAWKEKIDPKGPPSLRE